MNVIINLNKPAGITSRQAVTKVKRILGAKKAGHTGTLDPAATGVLLICVNEATKVSRFLLELDKEYFAGAKLGERTDTFDSQGRVIEKNNAPFPDQDLLRSAVEAFKGEIKQKPPMYSAVKMGGRPLYRLARKGIEIERPERLVQIHDIQLCRTDFPYFDFRVSCSKGTYIRTLCDDIGLRLGNGAHLVSLERRRIGKFSIEDALTFDDLLSGGNSFYSVDYALSVLKAITLSKSDYKKAIHGTKLTCNDHDKPEPGDSEFVRLKGPDGNLFGIGAIKSGRLRIVRLLHL